jgi:LuxR family maltose regulon positive regulatory protein
MNESTLVPDQLLATKFFVPHAPQALIARPRLAALLNDSLQHKLTLVSAPAGFGKTTLVADWLASRSFEFKVLSSELSKPEQTQNSELNTQNFRVAWVSLDEADNNLARFWTYVLTALDSCCPGIATPFVSSLQARHTPLEHVLTALINALLSIPEPLLLVLDDYDVVSEPAIHTSLAFLLEHLPPQAHLMVLARADPPLPLPRLRARGQVLEVRTDQLRCTHEEAENFLSQVMRIVLPPDVLQEAIAHSEGWLVGLQLLGLWLQTHADPSDLLNQLSGSHPYILDYLTEEVLQRQPEEVQTFLLHTAFLDRMCASLCDAVLSRTKNQEPRTQDTPDGSQFSVLGSQGMLEYLERSNLFVVPLDAQRRWYRYHPLFAEALRYRFEQTQPDQVPALHRRASRWYAEHGRENDAIEHALVAQDWQWAAGLIEQYRCDVALAELESDLVGLRQSIQRLPEEIVRSRPRLCLRYARALLGTMPPAAIDPWLAEAETTLRAALEAPPSEEERRADARYAQEDLLGEVEMIRALLLSLEGDGRTALTLCEQALTHLSTHNLAGYASVAYVQAMAYGVLGKAALAFQRVQEAGALARTAGDAAGAILSTTIIAMSFMARQLQFQGQLHKAWRLLQQAAQLGETPTGIRCTSVSWVYTIQADVLREWNRLDEAHTLVTRAIQMKQQPDAPLLQGASYAALARIERARSRPDAAHAAMQQAEQIVAQLPFSQLLAHSILELTQLWLADGAGARAAYWAEQLAQSHDRTLASVDEHAHMALARVALAEGKAGEALSRLAPLLDQARTTERWGNAIKVLVLQALADQMRHDERQALSALAEAVRRAEPEGYIRVFADEGAPLAALLARLRDQERRRGPTPYLDTLLAAFSRTEGRGLRAESLESTRSVLGSQSPTLVEPLSARELEVLQLIARGATNQEIAEELVLAVNTVKRHVSNIIAKLETANRTQAVAQARALGLLADEPSVASPLLAVAA